MDILPAFRELVNVQYKSRLSSYILAFASLRLRLKRKTHPAFHVLNAFYFQTDFNLRFKHKRDVRFTSHIIIQMAMPLTSHIIAQMDLTSGFGNISLEWN